MQFTKMEGAGNDYVYVDARNQEQDWPELSRRMSDRHFGVGSDGLILIADSDVADLKMVMFNADGSQGEMCGNGIRCFAKYAIERDIAAPSGEGLTVETLAGVRTVTPTYDGPRITGARVAMGAPILTPADVPVALAEELPPPVLAYPFSMDGYDLPIELRVHGQPPRGHLHRAARGRFPVARHWAESGASSVVSPSGELRDCQRGRPRQTDGAGVGAGQRRDAGLRHRRLRHRRGRPAVGALRR